MCSFSHGDVLEPVRGVGVGNSFCLIGVGVFDGDVEVKKLVVGGLCEFVSVVFPALYKDGVVDSCRVIGDKVCNKIGCLSVTYPCDIGVVAEVVFFEELLYPVGVKFCVVCPRVCWWGDIECVFVGVDVVEAFFSEYNGEVWLGVVVCDGGVEPCLGI